MELLTFIVVLIVAFVLWYSKKYGDFLALANKLPGPPALPLIGNALMFARKSPPELLKVLEGLSKSYGRTVRFLVGTQLQVLLTDPKDVETILGSQKLIEKSDEYDFIAHWLGTGLLISNGQKWFTRRKVITPTFHFKILEQFVEVFDKHSTIFVDNLSKLKGRSFDIFPLITLAALDVICGKINFYRAYRPSRFSKKCPIRLREFLSFVLLETAMGVEINAQINSESVYVKAVKE
jgi:cytochrome P450 family 4